MEERLMSEVDRIKPMIPIQTYRTIVGQIRAGDLSGAEVGLVRLKKRIALKEGRGYANRDR